MVVIGATRRQAVQVLDPSADGTFFHSRPGARDRRRVAALVEDGDDWGTQLPEQREDDPEVVISRDRLHTRRLGKLMFASVVTGTVLQVQQDAAVDSVHGARVSRTGVHHKKEHSSTVIFDEDIADNHPRHDGNSEALRRRKSTGRHRAGVPGKHDSRGSHNIIPPEPWRDRIYHTLSEPDSSALAHYVSVIIMLIIVFSVVMFIFESEPDMEKRPVFKLSEQIVIGIFCTEFALRVATTRDRTAFFKSPLNIIDFLAILPFFIELALEDVVRNSNLSSTRIVRVIRLFRVFRVFKLGGRIDKFKIVFDAVGDSADMLVMMLFMLALATVFFSTLIYFAENGATHKVVGNQSDPFDSIPQAFWWCIVTLMTVGYGDVVPVTAAGKTVASLTMVVSFIILALPISVIGANFTQQWILFKEQNALTLRAASLKPELEQLNRDMDVHNAVLDEMLRILRDRISAMDKTVHALRTGCVSAKAAVAAHEDVTEEAHAELEGTLEEAHGHREHIEEMFATAELVSSDDFLQRLDVALTKHGRLVASAKRGSEIASAVDLLLAEVDEFRSGNLFSDVRLGNLPYSESAEAGMSGQGHGHGHRHSGDGGVGSQFDNIKSAVAQSLMGGISRVRTSSNTNLSALVQPQHRNSETAPHRAGAALSAATGAIRGMLPSLSSLPGLPGRKPSNMTASSGGRAVSP